MTFIRNWSNCIIVVIILFSIVEMIVPNGNMKKHVMFVTGIIASLTISEPVLKLLKNDFNLEEVFSLNHYNEKIYNGTTNEIISSQVNSLEKIFANEILRKFNLEYPECEIIDCLVIFNKDDTGKIINIERINVSTYIKDLSIPEKLSKLCEIEKSKITIDVLETTERKGMEYFERDIT